MWNGSNDLFWKYESGDDYISAVQVTSCDNCEGPSNVYLVEKGTLYMGAQWFNGALSCIGNAPYDVPTLPDLVYGLVGYGGIERDSYNGESYVQHGAKKLGGRPGGMGYEFEPDYVLRKNANLERFIRSEFCD